MKTLLRFLCPGLVLFVGIHPITAQVINLGIAPAPGGQSVLYWPVSSTNYVLQTTTNLASPNWVTASNAVTVNAVTVTNSAPAGYFRLLATTNTTAGMVLIPAGSFTMGNYIFGFNTATNDSDITDANPTNVTVSAFYMDTNLVSYGQWTNVYAYATNHGYGFVHAGAAKNNATNQPVQTLDWYDCVKWCNARSQQAGLVPVYYTDAGLTRIYTNGEVTVYPNWSVKGYRLPTEAEWEKAARGGVAGNRFPWGNSISESQANYTGNTNSYSYDFGPNGLNAIGSIGGTSPATSPVGSFAPNGYGLYDIVGNNWQWCWDGYGTPYAGGTDPHGAAAGSRRVGRGGAWSLPPADCRVAFRSSNYPDWLGSNAGFRCVLSLGQ